MSPEEKVTLSQTSMDGSPLPLVVERGALPENVSASTGAQPASRPLKPGDWKMTVELLQGGQPRPYADTIYAYRVYFHWIPYSTKPTRIWQPVSWGEQIVRQYLKAVHGWTEEGEGDWSSSRLTYLREVGPGTWEFQVRRAFTD